MTPDELRRYVQSAAEGFEGRRETFRIMSACWPGGPDDRIEPIALAWLRRWRPARAAAPLPACSCASGHCAVCN